MVDCYKGSNQKIRNLKMRAWIEAPDVPSDEEEGTIYILSDN